MNIIFDLDGVIALTEDVHREAFDIAFAGYGKGSEQYDWNRQFAGKGHRFIVNTVFGDRPDNDRLIDKWVACYQKIAHRAKPVPGILEFIDDFSGSKMIIATGSARKSADIVLQALNITLPVVSMEDVNEPKPSPAIFLKAAGVLGVDPLSCCVFEDSFYGIQAAKKAGMLCIALTTTHPADELEIYKPDLIINNFTEL